MKKVKIKLPAKINLTLDIEGVKDGYHIIQSLVTSVNLFDVVRAKARKDGVISVTFKGIPIGAKSRYSNAYLAADSFRKEFGTGGADICIERGIPVAAGLGSSSADIAGTLKAMAKLYGINRDLTGLANELGSDVAYMLKGGFAVMNGRGNVVESVKGIKNRFYILIVLASGGVSTSESYKGFDRIGRWYPKNTSAAVKLLEEDDADNFFTVLKNDLYESSVNILSEIKRNVEKLKAYGAALMTGSGSAVYGIYKTKKERDKVYKALSHDFGARLIKAKTL